MIAIINKIIAMTNPTLAFLPNALFEFVGS